MKWAIVAIVVSLSSPLVPLAPSPTNPLCYNSAAYRNTHERECLISPVSASGPTGGGGGGPGGAFGTIRGIVHDLSGGLIG